jgi:hypothetical protein
LHNLIHLTSTNIIKLAFQVIHMDSSTRMLNAASPVALGCDSEDPGVY